MGGQGSKARQQSKATEKGRHFCSQHSRLFPFTNSIGENVFITKMRRCPLFLFYVSETKRREMPELDTAANDSLDARIREPMKHWELGDFPPVSDVGGPNTPQEDAQSTNQSITALIESIKTIDP